MAAGQGFKTFTTGEVLTAADVNGYLMQGVGVFDNATNRDAEITSPQEGQFAYLKDTNVTTYYTGSAWANLDTTGMTNPMTTTGDTIYSSSGSTPARLPIGSTGQVLQVSGGLPTWSTISAGGMTLLSTTTMSGSSVTISSISQSYKNLQVLVYGMNNGNNATFACTPNGTSSITNQAASTFGSINGAGSDGSNSNNIRLSIASNIKASTPANAFQFTIFDYSSTTGRKVIEGQNFFTDTGQDWTENYGGVIKTTSAITSLVFSSSSGTYSAGTILIYGVS